MIAWNLTGRFRRSAILATVCMLSVAPAAVRADTLADALVGAYNTSGLLDQNRALLRAADEDVAQAAAALKPIVRWTADIAQGFGRTTNDTGLAVVRSSVDTLTASVALVADLLLYDFGASQFRVEAAKETVLATRDALLGIEQNVLLRAVAAYMRVIEAQDFVALQNNNQRVLTQELRAARDRFEVGEVTRTDVSLAESQLALARSRLAAAEGDLLRAIEEYRAVVGSKPSRLAPPPSLPQIDRDIDTAKALAVRRHPDLRAAQHQVAAADLLVDASRAAMKPRVSANARYGLSETLNSSSGNATGSIGLSVGQTLYQGGALSSTVRRNMAQRDAQRANLHVVRENVQQSVGNAYADYAAARAQLEASDRQISAAEIAFRGVREEATLGARTTLDVLDAEQALLDARSIQVSARSAVYIAAYAVLAATGRLTAVDLKLPVQIYDPAAYYNLVKDGPVPRSAQGQKLDRVLRALQKD